MKRVLLVAGLLAGLLCLPVSAVACPMCRDTTAGSAPQFQRGLRVAIPVLGLPAGGIFLGILLLAFRIEPGTPENPAQEGETQRADPIAGANGER